MLLLAPPGVARTVETMTAAVFDIDNTLIRGSVLAPAGVALARSGIIDVRNLARVAWRQGWFRITGTEPRLGTIRTQALDAIRGIHAAHIEAVLDEVARKILAESTHRRSIELLQQHLRAGHEVWLATAGPGALARRLAELLGAHGAIGTEVRVVNGVCTGELDGHVLHGRRKADAVAELAANRGWDLTQVHAYSDSVNDLPLLNLVGRPAVVNPDRRLARHAGAVNWPVHHTSQRHTVLRLGASLAFAAGFAALRRHRR